MPSPYRRPAPPPDRALQPPSPGDSRAPSRLSARALAPRRSRPLATRVTGRVRERRQRHDGAPAEHPRADEDQGHDRERDLELAVLHRDAQRHADTDGHQPGDDRAAPGERRAPEPGREPRHDESDRERPPHAEEPREPGVLVVAAASDEDEHHEDGDVAQQRQPGSGHPVAIVHGPMFADDVGPAPGSGETACRSGARFGAGEGDPLDDTRVGAVVADDGVLGGEVVPEAERARPASGSARRTRAAPSARRGSRGARRSRRARAP